MTILLNIALGLVPTLILAGSISAGVADSPKHFRIFLLVYGLWAFTLAGWNWLESHHVLWVVSWGVFGILALAATMMMRIPPAAPAEPKSDERLG